jgi:hypothetical protein
MVYLVILGGLLIAAVVLYSIFNKKWDVPKSEETVAQDVLPQKEVSAEVFTQEEVDPLYQSSVYLAPETTVTVKEANLDPTPVFQETKKAIVKKKPAAKKSGVPKNQK